MSRRRLLLSIVLVAALFVSGAGLVMAQEGCGAARPYVVQWGDSVWRISQALGVSMKAVIDANPAYFQFNSVDYLVPGQVLCVPAASGGSGLEGPQAVAAPASPCTAGDGAWNPAGIPRVWITAVDPDKTVTIQTENFPPGVRFEARLGAYGTLAVGGPVVGMTDSCRGGAFSATYAIPNELKGATMIAIRLENYFTGHHAYNYFANAPAPAEGGLPPEVVQSAPAAETAQAAPAPACTLGDGVWNPAGIPRFWIASVEQDRTVTILTENFPPGTQFEARLGAYGTLGIGGVAAGLTDSCRGGAFRMTYTIPESLRGSSLIAIRLENYYTGYYAYNYFYNNTAVAIP